MAHKERSLAADSGSAAAADKMLQHPSAEGGGGGGRGGAGGWKGAHCTSGNPFTAGAGCVRAHVRERD